MPLSYVIDQDRRIVTITGDYAEPAEWRRMLTAVAADPAYPAGGCSFLRDVRAAEHAVGVESVVGIIGVVREFWGLLKVHRAAVLTRPAIDPPAMMAHALAEDQRIPLQSFTSYEDAVAWLTADRPIR